MKKKIMVLMLILELLMLGSFGRIVLAEENKGLHTLDIGKIVITPTRSEALISTIPASVSLITQKDIENSGADSIPEVLKSQAGLVVKDYMGNGKTVNIDMRGFGETGLSNVLVLIDGRRVNQIDLSGVDWTQIPLEQIERIEVIRGSASVLYGDNATGGVVNIITKEGIDKPSVETSISYGSYSTHKENVNFSGSIPEFSYSGQASYKDGNGYRENNSLLTKDFGINLAYKILDSLKLSLISGYHRDSYGMPGALLESEMKQMGRRSTTKPEDHADTEDYYIKLGIDANYYNWSNFLMDLSWRNRKTNSIFTLVSYLGESDIDTISVTPRCILKNDIVNHPNRLIAGLDFYYARDEIDTTSSSDKTDIDITKISLGPYIFDEFYLLDNLLVTTGFRYERAKYKFDSVTKNLSDAILSNIVEKKVPKQKAIETGLTYLFKNDSSIFMKYARSFRFGLVDEFFSAYSGLNAELKPQESKLYEVGIKYFFQDNFDAQLSLYNLDVDNEIYYDPNTYTNTNYDKTRHQGLELSWGFEPFKTLRIFGSYSYIKATFNGGVYDENDIPHVPINKASIGFNWEIMPELNLFVSSDLVDKRYFLNDFGNEYGKMKSYFTIDSKLSYKWKNLTASLIINNLFDEKYSEYGGYSSWYGEKYFYPSPERNFELKVSSKF